MTQTTFFGLDLGNGSRLAFVGDRRPICFQHGPSYRYIVNVRCFPLYPTLVLGHWSKQDYLSQTRSSDDKYSRYPTKAVDWCRTPRIMKFKVDSDGLLMTRDKERRTAAAIHMDFGLLDPNSSNFLDARSP